MTHEEYAEILRDALKAQLGVIALFSGECLRLGLDITSGASGVQSRIQQGIDALATPPPSNKLREMKDAPRDGKWFSAFVKIDGTIIPFAAYWDMRSEWFVSVMTGNIYASDTKTLLGWLPLPEVSE